MIMDWISSLLIDQPNPHQKIKIIKIPLEYKTIQNGIASCKFHEQCKLLFYV